ncbi:MAG TPA: hypothetical protein VGD46_19595 [Rhizobacter sp.]
MSADETLKRGVIIVGTIGHVDHGKTTLAAALASLAVRHAIDVAAVPAVPEEYRLENLAALAVCVEHVRPPKPDWQQFNRRAYHNPKTRPAHRPRGRGG